VAGVLVYAWNPLPIWEYAGNGHIDGASLGFMALALLVASTSRRGLTGAVLGLAILCKLLPAAIFPAFWRRWDWPMLAGTLLVIVALYAVYTVGAGWHVLGYLPGYAGEEGLETGQGFFALRAVALFTPITAWMTKAYMLLAGLGLLGLAAWYMLGPKLPADPGARTLVIGRAAAVLATATTVAISPHYPWYLGWLALFACFAPYLSVVYLSASGVLLYLDPYHREAIYPWVIYGPCIALAVVDVARARRTAR
jgi:alpha-1,6-mannosyltransferase